MSKRKKQGINWFISCFFNKNRRDFICKQMCMDFLEIPNNDTLCAVSIVKEQYNKPKHGYHYTRKNNFSTNCH